MMDFNYECWYDLANAIVLAAVEDWRKSKFQMCHPSLASNTAKTTMVACEKFFLSPYFQILTDLDGKVFLRSLKSGYSFT